MLLRTPIHQVKCYNMTLEDFQNEHTTKISHLIQALGNKLRTFCFLWKLLGQMIQLLYIIFNGNTIQKGANQKHFGQILHKKLTFNDHSTFKLTTVNKLSTLRNLYHYMIRDSLVKIYKSFNKIRPRLCRCYIWQNQRFNFFLIELSQPNIMLL